MSIRQETCPACAAPVTVPTDGARMRCPFCNTSLAIERENGGIGLELAEQITGQITETVERTGAQTLSELERMHLLHELSNRRLHLAQLQSEIRGLERMRIDATVRTQLRDLRTQEAEVQREIAALNRQLDPDGEVPEQPASDEQGSDPLSLQHWLWLLFSLNGRAARGHFWQGVAVVAVLFVSIALVGGTTEPAAAGSADSGLEPLLGLLLLFTMWMALAVQVKRLRARGQSLWWLALWLLPLFGPLWLLIQLGVLSDSG